ncbi:MAG TPA: hypothetical protein IAC37_01830 [Candidatus Ventrimonas merdavium]|nr:hypothetical protein [Candidatus Ventrimonas merdavium]
MGIISSRKYTDVSRIACDGTMKVTLALTAEPERCCDHEETGYGASCCYRPGATDIVINEVLNTDFEIVSIGTPTKGTVMKVNDRTLQWKIAQLGTSSIEEASLEFTVRHVGQTEGLRQVNQSVTYSDREGHRVTFPDPYVTVECDTDEVVEACPTPVDLEVTGCQDAVELDTGDTYLESQGRIVQLDVTVKHVCPRKRVALGVVLTEVDEEGREYQRGMKAMTIPAHNHATCRDVEVKGIKFVLPEDGSVPCNCEDGMCRRHSLRARLIAHNIDNDFQCYQSSTEMTVL